jgi:hypothetical protein
MHYPVVNKNGDTIASSMTNLDLHDISRAARSYGVRTFFVVTPLDDQKVLIDRIISHWTDGYGAGYNPARKEALGLIELKTDFEEVLEHIRSNGEGVPKVVVTSARPGCRCVGYGEFRKMIADGRPHLLVFGTAWGLAEEFIRSADVVLEPITGEGDYNHLSVRSAAAVILDRIVGKNR